MNPAMRRAPAVALLLCGGASARWGDRGPKALASVEGRPVLELVALSARSGGVDRVVAVVGASAERISSTALEGLDDWIVNPAWEQGQTSSILAGLRAVRPGELAVVWPVDTPFVAPSTVAELLELARRGPGLAVWFTPTFEGRGGHPIVLTPEGVALALRWDGTAPFREAPFRQGPGEYRLAVSDPAVRDNTNYPGEFAAAERAWRARGGASWTAR